MSLNVHPVKYSDELHTWMLKKQSKKVSESVKADLEFFSIPNAAQMCCTVDELSNLLPDFTVSYATVFVHCCEVRQCVNKFGLTRLTALCKLVRKSQAARALATSKREEVFRTGGSSECHAVQVIRSLTAALTIYSTHRLTMTNTQVIKEHKEY